MLRLLHTADWHLGRRFPSFPEDAQKKLSRARMDVITTILNVARRNAVDAVLCAGDLFDDPTPAADFWETHGEGVTTVLCAACITAGWLASRAGVGGGSTALFLVGYVLGGYRQAIEGVTTLFRERELDVDLLMVVAAIGAALIGYWFDGALLIFIFALSGTLEGYAGARTRRDIEALMALHPEDALVVRNGREERVPAAALMVAELFIVKPGERVAADGTVTEGASA